MMKRIGTLAGFFVLGYVVVRLYKHYKGGVNVCQPLLCRTR